MSSNIFISHATADKTFVTELREKLEAHDLPVWEDVRELRGGDKTLISSPLPTVVSPNFLFIIK